MKKNENLEISENIKKIIIYFMILIMVAGIIMGIDMIIDLKNDTIKRKNAEVTQARIVKMSEMEIKYSSDYKLIGNSIFLDLTGYTVQHYNYDYDKYIGRIDANPVRNYCKYITYTYQVNNVEYTARGMYRSKDMSEVENLKVGDMITITYDKTNANRSQIGYLRFVIYKEGILLCFFVLVIIIVGIMVIKYKFKYKNIEKNDYQYLENEYETKKKRNSKKISLVVIKVVSLDYERERVFFHDNENNLYFYETDFGDEIQPDEKYEINLNRYMSKKMKVEYEGEMQKSVQIVNVEKKEFVKI